MKPLLFYGISEQNQKKTFPKDHSQKGERYILPKNELQGFQSLTVTCEAFSAEAGDPGFYLLPYNSSVLTRFLERENCELRAANAALAFFAVGKKDAVYVVVPERYYDFTYTARCRDGHYEICLELDFSEQPPSDDVILNVLRLHADADYNDVAHAVRHDRLQKGEIAFLKDKCRSRECLDYFRRYPLIRIRMGWKPVPPPILHQTPENEPPMQVACDFARVRDIADELARQGVEGATLSLVGWNPRGHDGRWPQMFPVEEALGGEEELKKTIAHVQSLGYRITCHTNCLDHYEIADIFDWDNIALRKDGSYRQIGEWGGGAAYRACPEKQLSLAKEQLPRVRALGFEGVHYIDVLSIGYPDPCFSEKHPCSTRRGIECMQEIMLDTKQLFGGFSSEGGFDFTIGELDFSLYNRLKPSCEPMPKKSELIDEYIPMWELIYHGITLYNPCSGTVNFSVKGADEETTFMLMGGIPTFYFYSKFLHSGNNWMGESDLTCGTDEELVNSVAAIRHAMELYRVHTDRQFVLIDSFRHTENGLHVMRYKDGVEFVGNYTDHALPYGELEIPAHGYRVITG